MCKLFLLLLCVVYVVCAGSLTAQASPLEDWLRYTAPAQDTRPVQTGTELTVGTTTAMSGFFATDLWGMNAADLDVRMLLHGCQTIVWADGRPWLNGAVVKNVSVQQVADGDHVFVMEIADGLTYNDGTPITARDYVFSLLLEASTAVEALGGASRDLGYIQGFDAYRTGEKENFAGIYLVEPMVFALKIKEDALRNFYGPELLAVTPYPISVIAPGFDIQDEGEGAFFVKEGVHGGLTVELLAKTLLDAPDGYARNPRISSGPYMLTDFDGNGGYASFVINPQFSGDAWGYRPVIEKLTFIRVDEADAASQLSANEIQLMNRAFNPFLISQLRELEGMEVSYPRTGLAYLAFAAERGPGGDQAVRQAVALTLDREALVARYPDFERVYGYYGLGQWMAGMASEEELLSLDIPLYPIGANQLLDTSQWNLSWDGGLYVPAGGQIRFRDYNGMLEPLQLTFARSAQSSLADGVEAMLREGLARIGVDLVVVSLPFDGLLAQYYHQQGRSADLYFLASDFYAAFDPLNTLSEGADIRGYRDATLIRDPELILRAKAMLSAGFENRSGYLDAWMAFQHRFMEVLPMIPLYSGEYHDFYTADLLDYDVAACGSWAAAIVGARMRVD